MTQDRERKQQREPGRLVTSVGKRGSVPLGTLRAVPWVAREAAVLIHRPSCCTVLRPLLDVLRPLLEDMHLPTNEPAGAGESAQAEHQKEGTSEAGGRPCARGWHCHRLTADGPRGHGEVASGLGPEESAGLDRWKWVQGVASASSGDGEGKRGKRTRTVP